MSATGEAGTPGENTSLEALFDRIVGQKNASLRLFEITVESVRGQDPELADVLGYCAIPRRFDAEIIGVLRNAEDDRARNQQLLVEVCKQPFVIPHSQGGFVYHDTVRDVLLEQWRGEVGQNDFDRLNARLAAYYQRRHEEASELQIHFRRVSRLIKSANEERYLRLLTELESRVAAPLLEALYHNVLRSADVGFEFFQDQFYDKERSGHFSLCLMLVKSTRDYLSRRWQVSESEGRVKWLDYFEARAENRLQNPEASKGILTALLEKTGDDTKLRLWSLAELGESLGARFELRDALPPLNENLQLALETGVDEWNLPLAFKRVADVQALLEQWREAVENYGRSISSAQEQNNFPQQAWARVSLASTLFSWRRVDEGVEAALQALDFARTEQPEDLSLSRAGAEQLMAAVAHAHPHVSDALFTEATELYRANGDSLGEQSLASKYIERLSECGRLRRAEQELEKIKTQGVADAQVEASIAFAQAWLREAQGRLHEAIVHYDEVEKLASAGQGKRWLQAAAITNRGNQYHTLGQWSDAQRDRTAALRLWQEIGHDNFVALVGVQMAVSRLNQDVLSELQRIAKSRSSGQQPVVDRIQGYAAMLKGEWQTAERHYQAALKTFQGADALQQVAEVNTELAQLDSARGQWQRAATHAAAACEVWRRMAEGGVSPEESLAPLEGHGFDEMRRRLDAAMQQLTASAAKRRVYLLETEGHIARHQGRWGEAKDRYAAARAIALEVGDWVSAATVGSYLAGALAAQGEWAEACDSMGAAEQVWQMLAGNDAYRPNEQATSAAAENARGTRELILARRTHADLRRARSRIRAATKEDPDNFLYHLNLAYASARLEEWGEAASALEAALQRRPANLEPCTTLLKRLAFSRTQEGAAACRDGKLAPAESAFDAAKSTLETISGDDPTAVLFLADLWIAVGDGFFQCRNLTKAEVCYRASLPSTPRPQDSVKQTAARLRLGFLAAISGRHAESAELMIAAIRFAVENSASLSRVVDEFVPAVSSLDDYRKLSEGLRRVSERPELQRNELAAVMDARSAFSRSFSLVLDRAARVPADTPAPASSSMTLVVTPIAIEAHGRLLGEKTDPAADPPFMQYLPEIRERILNDIGINMPGVRVHENSDLPDDTYIIMINEIPLVTGVAYPDRLFDPASSATPSLETHGLRLETFNPISGENDGVWIEASIANRERYGDAQLLDHFHYMARHLETVVRSNLQEFFNLDELNTLLGQWVVESPKAEEQQERRSEMLRKFLPDTAARWNLVEVVRQLLAENVPIKPIGPILEVCATTQFGDVIAIVEVVRAQIRDRLPGNDRSKQFLHLSSGFEDVVDKATRPRRGKRFLALEPELVQELLGAVRDTLGDRQQSRTTIVTHRAGIRPFVRRLLEIEFPRLAVLAEQELLPEITGHAFGVVRLGREAPT